MNRAEFITLARTVAELRGLEADASRQMRKARDLFEADHASEIVEMQHLQAKRENAEAALRAGGLELYRETGDKHPAPGVEVKDKVVLEYEQTQALKWAVEHGIFLQLDVKGFEKAAQSLSVPFVTYKTVPQAQLARDMDKALAELPKTI